MKKLTVKFVLLFSVLTSAQVFAAVPMLSSHPAVVIAAKSVTTGVPLLVAGGVVGLAYAYRNTPVPYNLTAACQGQFVQKAGANYGSVSFEHCLNK